jgi:hypothetical protein
MPSKEKDVSSAQHNIANLFNAWYPLWIEYPPKKVCYHYWNSKLELNFIRTYIDAVDLQGSLSPAIYQPIITALDQIIEKYATGSINYKVYTEDPNNVISPEGLVAVKTWFDTYIIKLLDLCKK